MTARAQDFLDNWVAEFVATGQSPSADLSSIALEEAADEGIGADELQATAGGELGVYLSTQLARLQSEENENVEGHAEGQEGDS